ncbi:acyltransferase [Desulfovibrio sp. UCD-KL4C]|uniref:acyltransferase family protein n=1 Tax=Desulfovibrio sp. UCD-KL4C TaxID=2578120 RepID=UPI0025C52ABB|nr:acyltransferase [Desulfovibrio sp. UCD-KL4C]
MTNRSQYNKLNSLQILRAIAAILVCFSHVHFSTKVYSAHFNMPSYESLAKFESFFRSGVDIFFIISGFVMAYVVTDKKINLKFCKNFACKRILRIYPMYWIVLSAYAIYSYIFSSGGQFHSFKTIVLSSLLTPGYRLLPISWTLTFEMTFYIIFTISLLISIIEGDKFILAISIISLAYALSFLLQPTQDTFGILQSPLLYEFVIGIFIAKMYINKLLLPKLYAYLLIIIYFIIVYYNISTTLTPNGFSWEYIIRWGGSSSLIVYALICLEYRGVNFPQILHKIGDSSYSLYLLHALLMTFFVKTWVKLDLPPLVSPRTLTLFLLLFAITASYLAYITLEKPMLKFTQKKFLNK